MSEDSLKNLLDDLFDYYEGNLTRQAFLSCNIKIIKYAENHWTVVKHSCEGKIINKEFIVFNSSYDLALWLISFMAINSEEFKSISNVLDEDLKLLRRI